jgi:hypothetical protein
MLILGESVRSGGMVEGLGDEEIPWWTAPYVRDFTGLAKNSLSPRNGGRNKQGQKTTNVV